MDKNESIKRCVVCGIKKNEDWNCGRIIDGSDSDDKFIPKKYWGKWVCSFNCYEKLLRVHNNEIVINYYKRRSQKMKKDQLSNEIRFLQGD